MYHASDGGAVNEVGNSFASLLDAAHERLKVAEIGILASNLHHVAGEGNTGHLADLVENGCHGLLLTNSRHLED